MSMNTDWVLSTSSKVDKYDKESNWAFACAQDIVSIWKLPKWEHDEGLRLNQLIFQ